MSAVKWHPIAVSEFLALDNNIQEDVNQKVEKLPDKGLSWEDVSRVKRERIGLDAFRLKINPEDNSAVNHRIIFDVDNADFLIATIGVRPDFYTLENLKKVEKRL
jgi:mRNA-degrading endonuclease RelE of RelBE toxin-antitoxin system